MTTQPTRAETNAQLLKVAKGIAGAASRESRDRFALTASRRTLPVVATPEAQLALLGATVLTAALLTAGQVSNDDGSTSPAAAKSKIAFITTGGSFRLQLSVINADGSGERRLAYLGPWVAHRAHFLASRPAWSPNGRRIAYAGVRDDGNLDIYVVRVDGRGRRRLTRPVFGRRR